MKALYSVFSRKFLCCTVFALILSLGVNAQQYLTKINGWNAYIHLPDDYNSTTQTYPVIIYVPGIGEIGTDPASLLKYGPSHYISLGVNLNQFTVNAAVVKPIFISIQPIQSYPGPALMNTMFDSISARFRVDPDRFYGTGLSMGGFAFDNYITYSSQYAQRMTALVMMSAVVPNYPFTNFQWFAKSGGTWWGFQGDQDGSRQMPDIADTLNKYAPGSAKITIYSGGHCCWNDFYDPNYRENGQNIYEWLLSQKRTGSPTPPAPNQSPAANAGNDINITLPTNSVNLDGSSSSDPDGNITAYNWSRISGPASFSFANASAAKTAANGLVQGVYQFELRVTDNGGATAKDTITVTVNAGAPQALVSNAGNDQTITSPTSSITLNGSGTGNISSYGWQKISGPSQYSIASPAAAQTVVSNLAQGTYQFSLTITDNTGATAADTVAVTVNAAAAPAAPVPNAGTDKSITSPASSVALAGTASGNIVSYNWQKISGPGQFVIATPTSASTTVSNLIVGTYQFALTVTDNAGVKASDTLNVLVKAAAPAGNCGCDITLAPTTPTDDYLYVDGSKLGVQPGNKICIKAGNYNHITLFNFQGTASQPLTFINCGGRVICGGVGSYGGIVMKNCRYFRLTGTGDPGYNYGINIGEGSPVLSTGVSLSQWTSDFEVDHIEVTNVQAGFFLTFVPDCDPTSWSTYFTIQNVSFHDNYIHDTDSEGMYLGNSPVTYDITCNGVTQTVQPQHINNMKIYNNLLERTGWDGIQCSNTPIGLEVFNNVIRNFGTKNLSSQQAGIIVGGGTNGKVYNNLIDGGTGNAIQVLGVGTEKIYNNIIINTGYDGTANGQDGIIIDDRPNPNSYAPLQLQINNNTIISPRKAGIVLYNDYGTVGQNNVFMNNIIVAPGSGKYIYITPSISSQQTTNLLKPTVAEALFVNPSIKDFHLQAGSPAVNTGTNTSTYGVVTDYDGNARPTGSAYDIGAYEYTTTPPPPNKAPVANAGADKSIILPTNTVSLTGTGTDTDGTIVGYLWSKISGPAQFAIVNANSASTAINNLVQGVYSFELTVTDDKGAVGKDTVVVTVNAAANQPPIANAGANKTITLPTNSVSLSGSGTDPDGTISTYAWTYISGPAQYNIVSPAAAATTINNLVQGTYQFQLTVTDNNGATGKATVSVTVNPAPNQVPVSNAGPDQNLVLPTSSTTLDGTASQDPDGTITTYAWTKIAGPGTFTITNPAAATTTVTNLVQGSYQFRLTVTDNNGATDPDVVIINVTNAANQPPVASAGANQSITLPTNSGTLDATGSSDADGTIASYLWEYLSGPAQYTITNAANGSTTATNLVVGVYKFRVTVTDNSGASAQASVTITVNAAANLPPTANAGSDQTITLPANTANLNGSGSNDADGSIVSYSWAKISGPSQFSISNPTGASTAITNLVQGTYQFELTVVDNDGASAKDQVTVVVNAAANQAPVANAGTNINVAAPIATVVLDGSKSYDPDGSITTYSWSKISGPSPLTVTNSNTAKPSLQNPAAGVYVFELTITDNSGATAKDQVTVTVTGSTSTNVSPVVLLTDTLHVALPANSASLDGSASYDPDGSIVTYNWNLISGSDSVSILSPAEATTTVTGLSGGTYAFELVVTDNKGAVTKGTVYVVVGNDVTRLEVPIVTLYPNPARTTVTIKLDGNAKGRSSLIFYDVNGRVVLNEEFIKDNSLFNKPVDVSRLPSGTYFVEIRVDRQDKVVKKLIKIN